MIAITVVMAAIIFVLLDSHGDGTGAGSQGKEPPPAIRIQRDESGDRLRVLSAYVGEVQKADWAVLVMMADKPGTEYELNSPADGVGGTALSDSPTYIAPATDIMTAGEYVAFCGTSGEVTDVTFSIVHEPANSMIAQIRLNNIAPC